MSNIPVHHYHTAQPIDAIYADGMQYEEIPSVYGSNYVGHSTLLDQMHEVRFSCKEMYSTLSSNCSLILKVVNLYHRCSLYK